MEKERTVRDWVLILLYARKDKPIDGKLMFVKELFLLEKEIFPKLPGNNESFAFYPYDLGPYSTKFAKTLNELIRNGHIEAIPLEDTENYRFKLTEEGIMKAKDATNKISNDALALVTQKRKGWDQLGYFGITRRIYSRYPEYTIRSKIRKDVMK